ncbi:MAG TPA: hemerythrin domain-containing protein [Allosphingosinicella sp.]|nr:hemerythrin domain-containing protein [Allosphingosinicella sp.]
MATRSRSRASARGSSGNSEGSAFSWGNQAGTLALAAVAGAAVGLAANFGRKLMVQGIAGKAGAWDEVLHMEHETVLALFDQIQATSDDQVRTRTHLLAKIKAALGKHALQEENVIYPALREFNNAHDADALNGEHGYVKTFLYELENSDPASTDWLAKVRTFRAMLEEHIRMEEDEVFPALKAGLDEAGNAKLGAAMLKEGMKLA